MPLTTFSVGQVLTAANMTDLQKQAVITFTNEAARDAAITAPSEGMMAYLTAPTVPAAVGTTTFLPTGILTVYNGSAWVCVTGVGSQSPGGSANFGTTYANVTVGGVATSVTLSTGTTAVVSYQARINGNGNFACVSVSGTGVAASDNWSAFNQAAAYITVGRTFVMSGLTAGTNTFTVQGKNNVAGGNCDQITLWVAGIA